ncbi:MAG: hypothetical protein PVF91_14175 [Chromatiales bacterium]
MPENTASEEQINAARLGETSGEMLLEGRESLRLAVQRLFDQANERLDLFTWDLEPAVFDSYELFEQASRIARRTRHSRIRIMVQESRRAAQDGHALVRLAQRLPSHVQIRKPHKDFEQYRHSFLIADGRGLLYRHSPDLFEATVDFNAPEQAQETGEFFDRVWELSQQDVQLRRLSL